MGLKEIVTTDAIYVDSQQDVAAPAKGREGFVVTKLQWHRGATPKSCDYAWVDGGKLVALEEKKPSDFESSIGSRRLQRELRGMLDEADVAVLGLRLIGGGGGADWTDWMFGYSVPYAAAYPHWRLEELAKWQAIGGGLVFMPSLPQDVLVHLERLRRVLRGDAKLFSIVGGSDHSKRPTAPTKFQMRVRRLFDGLGEKMAVRLDAEFGGDLMLALQSGEKRWRKGGAHRGIIKQLKEIQGA